ncbi:MAG: transglycosylase SLT domain-containing protein, partial [Burkholderiales bacterium]|nr:transglycosylase SLT domain-containing protein [Burkholderiales bacterium]
MAVAMGATAVSSLPRAAAPAHAEPAAAPAPAAPPRLPAVAPRITAAALARAERLAVVVARRYRVAEGAAETVVGAAFREGARHNLDPMLILAVIAVESRFNPFAASEQGALGLMQVVPRFHMDKIAAVGVPSMLLPETNIAIGTRILKDSIQRGGSDAAGLQLYNGAFEDETQAYANRVLTERRRLEGALPRERNKDLG